MTRRRPTFTPLPLAQFLPRCEGWIDEGDVCDAPHPFALRPRPATWTSCHVCALPVAPVPDELLTRGL